MRGVRAVHASVRDALRSWCEARWEGHSSLVSPAWCRHKHVVPALRPIAVAVFEDQPEVLRQLQSIFDSDSRFRCVAAELSLRDAVARVNAVQPDVVILDIQFESESGLGALSDIRKARPEQPVLMHTVVDTGEEILLAYMLGASGYFLKGDGRSTIEEAVRVVAEGGAILSPRIAWAMRQMTLGPRQGQWILKLTPAELDVLDLLAKGFAAKEIAKLRDKAVGTVEKQCEAIRRKAAMRSIRQVVAQAGPWARVIRAVTQLWKLKKV